MCCDCTHLAYLWVSYSAVSLMGEAAFGRGLRDRHYNAHPPLLGTGGTTIPKQGDWVYLSQCETRGYGILADGSLWGWGAAPLGDGTLNNSLFPKKISSERWKKVDTCRSHTVAIREDGTLWTWGDRGCSGDGTSSGSRVWYDNLDTDPKAILNSSIESLRQIDTTISSSVWAVNREVNLQPSSVRFTSSIGSGASATCQIYYTISVDEYVLSYYMSQWTGFSSPPSVVVTHDPRDVDHSPATFSVTINADGRVSAVKCTSGGEYMYLPIVRLVGPRADGTEFSFTIAVHMTSVRVDLSLVSGGSGYSHRIDNPIAAALSFPNREGVVVAYANLAPSSIDRIETPGSAGEAFCGDGSLQLGTASCQYEYANWNDDFSSLTPTATLVSYEDPDLPLTVTKRSDQYPALFDISHPAPIANRKTPGHIMVKWPSFTFPESPPLTSQYGGVGREPPVSNSKPAEGPGFPPYRYLDGEPSEFCPTGFWSIVDRFAGGAAAVCTSTASEEYVPYEKDPSLLLGFYANKPYTPLGNYSSGPPLHPLKQFVPWGKVGSVAVFGSFIQQRLVWSPEYTYSRTIPELTQWIPAPVIRHARKASPPPVTLLIYSNNVGGQGLAVSSSWSKSGTLSSNASVERHVLSYSITNHGSGYTYEPEVRATFDILSPQRVGDRSDWTDACCSPGGTAGIAGGWPYVWGGGASSWVESLGGEYAKSSVPTRMGFGLDIRYSGVDSPFNESLRYFGSPLFSSSALRPHTKGYIASPRKYSFTSIETPFTYINHSEPVLPSRSWRWGSYSEAGPASDALGPFNPYYDGIYGYSEMYYANPNYDSFLWSGCASRYHGISKGLYSVSQQSLPASLVSKLPEGFQGYQTFVPVQYDREFLRPLSVRSAPDWSLQVGSCYTHAPEDIGYGLTATLLAPSSFRKLFVYNNSLFGTSSDGELWILIRSGTTASLSSSAKDLGEQEKVALKAWSATKDVTWTWETDTVDVSVIGASELTYGQPTASATFASIGTYSHTYLLPPQQSSSGENIGYVDSVSVFPSLAYKLVITDPGTGYKDGDNLSFIFSGGRFAVASRSTTFTYLSHEMESVDLEKPLIEYDNTYGSTPSRLRGWSLFGGFGGAAPGQLGRKPFERPLSGVSLNLNPTLIKQTESTEYLKSLTCRLKDNLTFREFPAVGHNVGQNYAQFGPLINPSYVIADGGVYMNDFGGFSNSFWVEQHTAKTEITTGEYVVAEVYTRIPTVSIEGGSGTGAKAKLVPALLNRMEDNDYYIGSDGRNNSSFARPFRVSRSLANAGLSLKDSGYPYGILQDGSLRSYDNPLVATPASYPSGFAKVDSTIALTSSGDAYVFKPTGNQNSAMTRPVAAPNVDYIISDPGKNYTLPPLIEIAQSSQDVAVVDAILDGKLVSLGVDRSGAGYRTAPTLTLSGGGGTGATAEAVISGPVDRITVTTGGGGYKAPPRVVFGNTGLLASASASVSGSISALVVAEEGDGYIDRPSVAIVGGGGSGATAEAVMKKRVSSIKITGRVGLYNEPPSVTITGGAASEQAVAEVITSYNSATKKYYVSQIRVTHKGNGYSDTPTVSVSSEDQEDGSRSEVFVSVMMDQYVSSMTLLSGGYGYSSPPSVMLSGSSSSNARITCLLSMEVKDVSLTSGGRYRSPPQISFEPLGTLQSISLTSGGSGYTSPPRVMVIDSRGLGDGGQASCTINRSGSVTGVSVTAVGSGYDVQFPPSVVFIGGGGSGASASASVEKSGGGASASCLINGSILYAKVTNAGSGYQFSPSVSISGGSNELIAEAGSLLASGAISQEESDTRVRDARGFIQSRIEGTISRFDIINPGNFYRKGEQGTEFEWPHTGLGSSDPVSMRSVSSKAILAGGGRPSYLREVVEFEAPANYPGGPISQPLILPTTKFSQKPRVTFSNTQTLDVQEFKQSIRTSLGTRSRKTYPAATTYATRGMVGVGPYFPSNSLTFVWSDSVSGQSVRGFGGLRFESGKGPQIVASGEGGSGMSPSVSLDSEGSVQSVSVQQSGSGYVARSIALRVEGGVLRHTPCVATCVVSGSGQLVGVTIQSTGSGYVTPAAVVHGGRGSGATLSVERATSGGTGGIQSITVTSGGSGYSQSNPPEILVYETSGYFSSSPIGERFQSGLTSALSQYGSSDYPIKWTSYETEYSPPIENTSQSDVLTEKWEAYGGYEEDAFGCLTEAVNLTCNLNLNSGRLNGTAYESPPAVSVRGSCERQMSVATSVVKWKDVFSQKGAIACGIRRG